MTGKPSALGMLVVWAVILGGCFAAWCLAIVGLMSLVLS